VNRLFLTSKKRKKKEKSRAEGGRSPSITVRKKPKGPLYYPNGKGEKRGNSAHFHWQDGGEEEKKISSSIFLECFPSGCRGICAGSTKKKRERKGNRAYDFYPGVVNVKSAVGGKKRGESGCLVEEGGGRWILLLPPLHRDKERDRPLQ